MTSWGNIFLPSRVLTISAVLLLAANRLAACTVCFGKLSGDLANGLNLALVLLLAVTTFVLGGFAAFFLYLWRRSKAVLPTDSLRERFRDQSTIGED